MIVNGTLQRTQQTPARARAPRTASASLGAVLAGLEIHAVEGVVHLDKQTSLEPLDTRKIRGGFGYALRDEKRELVRTAFKPGQGSHLPAPYVFQPLTPGPLHGNAFPFRFVTFDRGGELIQDLAPVAFQKMIGRRFGKRKKVIIAGFSFGEPERLAFEPLAFGGSGKGRHTVEVKLMTPMCLRPHTRVDDFTDLRVALPARDLTLGHLCRSAVARLNALSQCHGSGNVLDESPFLVSASFVREGARELKDKRIKSSGNDLEGIVGTLRFPQLPGRVYQLLLAAAVTHAGHNASKGCGCVQVHPVAISEADSNESSPRSRCGFTSPS